MNIIPHRLVLLAALLWTSCGLYAQKDWQVKQTSFREHTVNQTSVVLKTTPVDISSSIRLELLIPFVTSATSLNQAIRPHA